MIRLALATLAVLAAGPALPQPKPPASVGVEVSVGNSASGVPCRLRLQQPGGDGGNETYRLVCEGWDQPVATIGREPQRRFTAPSLVTDAGWINRATENVLSCGDPQPGTLLGDVESARRRCTVYEGGWPAVALAARADGKVVFGWAPADALPVMETAFALLLGRAAPGAGKDAQSISAYNARLLEATLGAAAKVPGLGDQRDYHRLADLALEYNRQRDYVGSENAWRRALDVQERAFGRNTQNAFRALSEIGLQLGQQRRFAEAEAMYARAEAVVGGGGDANDRRRHLAYRATTAALKGDLVAAKAFADRSVELAQTGQRPGRGERYAHSLIAAVTVYVRLGDWAASERLSREAIRGFESSTGRVSFWPMRARLTLATALSEQGRHADAEAAAREAVALSEQLYGNGLNTVNALNVLGATLDRAGKPTDALEAFRRSASYSAKDRAGRFQLRPDAMRRYVDALLRAADATPATAPARHDEILRALQIPGDPVVARAVTLMAARLADGDPAVRDVTRGLQDANDLLARQRQQYAQLVGQPADRRDAKREEAAAATIRASVDRIENLERRLQAANPRYARLTAPAPLSAEEVGRALKPGEALLMLVTMEDRSIGVLVRDGRAFAWRIAAGDAALAAQVDRLRAAVDWARRGASAFDLAEAHALYRDLLGPADSRLDGVTHLVVVPGGALASLPPALLVRRPAAAGGYAGAAWLARDMALSTVPSVSALAELRQTAQPSKATRPFIGFGAPAFQGVDAAGATRGLATACREGDKLDPALVRALAPLPETADEVRGMARALKAPADSVVTGAAATKGAVTQRDLSQYRVLAFATHGLLPGELACENEPALALTPAATAGDDGLLNASDIARLRLDADWVVLSACNTAGGRRHRARRAGALRPRARLPLRGIARRARDPLGDRVRAHGAADDGHVHGVRQARHRPCRGAPPSPAGDARGSEDRAPGVLGRLRRGG